MHFIGMAALQSPAHQTYQKVGVAAAVVGAALFAAAAFVLFKRVPPGRRTVAGALALTLAICTGHFVAMSALTLVPDPSVRFDGGYLNRDWLALAVASVAILLLLIAAGAVVAHRQLDVHVAESRRFRSLADASAEGIIIARGNQILEINERMSEFLREGHLVVEDVSLADILPDLDLAPGAPGGRAVETELVLGLARSIPVEVLHRSITHQGRRPRSSSCATCASGARRTPAFSTSPTTMRSPPCPIGCC